MKRRTYKNFMRALKMIQAKGYNGELAEKLTRQCFDNLEQSKNGMSVEWWIDKIIPADDKEDALT